MSKLVRVERSLNKSKEKKQSIESVLSDQMIKNNQTYYYHADGLGSIITITNSADNVVQRYEYDSFGNITYVLDPNFKQPYTYTGREYDNESGLYYYRARYYDAKIGRFLQQDPILSPMNPMSIGISRRINKNIWLLPYLIGYPKFLQPYSYTGQNPVNFTDPFGLHTYVPVGTTPDGGIIYRVYDDNGRYTIEFGERPAIYDVAEGAGACYLNTMDKIAGLSESMPVHPSGKPYPGFFRDLWNSLLPLRRFYGLP